MSRRCHGDVSQRRVNTLASVDSSSLLPTFLPMAATPGNLWACVECGKVCRSRGGLVRHSSVHKRHPHIGELHNNFQRVYHPLFDGTIILSSNDLMRSDCPKGNHAAKMESSFHPDHHQLPHPRSQKTIGPPSYRVPGLSSLKYCTPQHHSQTTLSTDSSASGVPHWFLTTTLRQYLTTKTFTQQLMPLNLATYPGSRIPFSITVSAQKMRPYPSG